MRTPGDDHPAVSVIIPAHNARPKLPDLLEALDRQTGSPAFEVLLVDDLSSDGTPELAGRHARVRVLRPSRRLGSYRARNLAASEARASLLAFTDADCVPDPDWIARGIARFEEPGVEMLGGEIRMAIGDRPTAVALLDGARSLDQSLYVRSGYAATANMWIRKDAFERVGPFNPNIVSSGDGEFGFRARATGIEIVFADDVRVSHPPRRRLRDMARKGFRLGVGAAQAHYHAQGPLGERRLQWKDPGWYVPRRVQGLERLFDQGYSIGPPRYLQLHLINYLCLTLPIAAGSLIGSLAHRTDRFELFPAG